MVCTPPDEMMHFNLLRLCTVLLSLPNLHSANSLNKKEKSLISSRSQMSACNDKILKDTSSFLILF